MPKIIYSDNIPDDISSETIWASGVTEEKGKRICDILNEDLGDYQGSYFRVVPDDHKLYKWEP